MTPTPAAQDYCNLEVMAEAERYNAFLLSTVCSAAGAPGGRHVIDFGAGAGTFAHRMREAGYNVACVETETHLQAILRVDGFHVASDLAEVPAGQADFIYSLNVLEHIPDDRAALRGLASALRPGGRILIYVPAFMSLFTAMDRKVGHLRRYRLAPLATAMEEAGFAIERAGYVDSLGFPATLLYRLIGSGQGDINLTLLRIYDRLVFPISRLLDRLTQRLFGKNLLIVGRRMP